MQSEYYWKIRYASQTTDQRTYYGATLSMHKSAETLNNQPQVQSNSHTIYIQSRIYYNYSYALFKESQLTMCRTCNSRTVIWTLLNNFVMLLLLLLLLHQNLPIHLPKSLPFLPRNRSRKMNENNPKFHKRNVELSFTRRYEDQRNAG